MLRMQHRIVALLSAMVLLFGASVAQASQCVLDTSADHGEPLAGTEVILVPTSPVPASFDATVPAEVHRAPVDGCDAIEIEGDDVPMCASEGASEVAPRPIEPTSDAAITAPPCDDASAALASVTQSDDERHERPTASPAGHAVLPTLPALPAVVASGTELPRREHRGPSTATPTRIDRPPRG